MAGPSKKKQKTGARVSPYMNFCKCKFKREQARNTFPGLPDAKALSLLWKSLSDHEKSSYYNKTADADAAAAADANADADAYEEANPSAAQIPPSRSENEEEEEEEKEEEDDEAEIKEKDNGEGEKRDAGVLFPLTRVKRIMKIDKDVKQAPNEVSLLVSVATQGFLQILADASWAAATDKDKKRKSIRLEDVVAAVSRQSRFADFLDDCLTQPASQDADVDNQDRHAKSANNKNSKRVATPLAGNRSITHFFGSKLVSDIGS